MTRPTDLPDTLNSAVADQLRSLLSQGGPDPVIDGTRVRSIGGLCAQELYNARRSALAAGGSFMLTPSPEMAEDLRLLGLSELLETSEVAR